jgi:Sec-independent protein translocase protein TatA
MKPPFQVAPPGQPSYDVHRMTIENSKFLGGDIEHTHLVKGLDFALLQKVRVGCPTDEVCVQREKLASWLPSRDRVGRVLLLAIGYWLFATTVASGVCVELGLWCRARRRESLQIRSENEKKSKEEDEEDEEAKVARKKAAAADKAKMVFKSATARSVYDLLTGAPVRPNLQVLPKRSVRRQMGFDCVKGGSIG